MKLEDHRLNWNHEISSKNLFRFRNLYCEKSVLSDNDKRNKTFKRVQCCIFGSHMVDIRIFSLGNIGLVSCSM